MPSLIISNKSQFESVFHFQTSIQIGRSPRNDVLLDAVGVSRHHASIERQNGEFFLIDEGSTNGTFIENNPVQRHLLTNGISFRIQDLLLAFVEDVSAHDAQSNDVTSSANMQKTHGKLSKTMQLTRQVIQKKGFRHKVSRLLKMVSDLIHAPTSADSASLVLDALIDITGAERGMVALKKKSGDPDFTHMRGFELHGKQIKACKIICQKTLETGKRVCSPSAGRKEPAEGVHQIGPKSVLCVPLICDEQTIGCIYLDHPNYSRAFSETDRDLLVACAEHIAGAFLYGTGQSCRLASEDARLASELKQRGIIARSAKTLKVFRDCATFAQYNVSVLIFGETGTGKEIIARYIHNKSGRKGRFVARNCSAIAASMFESELFGHEKGAFTGAANKKLGMLELADKGTLFLDEIGDMPAELQAKVLRALQEQEVWRVGGNAPIKIDVRVLAATHMDIKKRRKQLNFRDDLYYRLANVEITAPRLRERPEDIGPLCDMILETFRLDHQDSVAGLSILPSTLRLLEAYDWPGNIRELRNTLIKTSLRCDGPTIEPRHLKGLIDIYATPSELSSQSNDPLPSLSEVERDHIIKALKRSNWNKSTAAKLLSIDRNRLNRRLKKLGIDKSTAT
ncbi:MAG: sigma 54-interacting transcriptional regulator [Deltaproteobacteria bacterium]|nr:sigma 54-interacting transcriptional regulator [Deltaproteobacteria bacterium]